MTTVTLAAVALLLQTGSPTAREAAALATLEADLPHLLELTGAPGLNLAIARRGEVIYQRGFGYADLERRIPMTARTVTHSGSMGKTYTATAVMQLVERGLLALDAPVNRYLTGWSIVNPLGDREVTVRDLLTHRSGLAPNGAWSVVTAPKPLAEHVRDAYGRERNDFYGGAASPTWTAKVGAKYQYSNLGIATLGLLVEVVNPERLAFSEYVQRHIVDPLGMTSTQFPPVQDSSHIRPEIWARMSRGYTGLGPIRVPTPTIYFEDHPAGTVVTTPADHIRLLLAMQHEGRYRGFQLLQPETVRLMLTPDQESPAGGEFGRTGVGLVWNLRNWGTPTASFGHGGAHMWGWTNTFIAYPELDLAIAVFMNYWSLPNDAQGGRYQEAKLVIDYLESWANRERQGLQRTVTPRSWAWKVSYLAGLMLVDHTNGVLGIAQRLTERQVAGLVRAAAPRTGRGTAWDPAGFRAGVADLSKEELTPASIKRFLGSDRLQVLEEELPFLYLALGGRGSFPAPN